MIGQDRAVTGLIPAQFQTVDQLLMYKFFETCGDQNRGWVLCNFRVFFVKSITDTIS